MCAPTTWSVYLKIAVSAMPDELLSAIANGNADLVSFGALFLANPDSFVQIPTSGDEKGYTNYSFLYLTTIIH